MRRAIAVGVLLVLASSCADQLPDQDRRILVAAPAAKVSTDILWAEYQGDNKASADKRYWGKAVEITGKVSTVEQTPPRIIFLPPYSSAGIEARPLDDQAAATLAAAKPGERMTLRCFCAGRESNVILKSCIKP